MSIRAGRITNRKPPCRLPTLDCMAVMNRLHNIKFSQNTSVMLYAGNLLSRQSIDSDTNSANHDS